MSGTPGPILASSEDQSQRAELIPHTFRHPSTNLSTHEMSCLLHRGHIQYLRQINSSAIRSMQGEIERQRQFIEELATSRDRLAQKLGKESIYRAMADQALSIERNSNQDMATTIASLRQEISLSQTACFMTGEALKSEQKRLHETALELDYTRRKFYLVDSLVDTMLLQEDSELELGDRSRQITDLILDLESQMENKYRALIVEKDDRIALLESSRPVPVESESCLLDSRRQQD